MNIPENLYKLRKEHGFTQQQIAEHLNITQRAYSNYETGKRTPDINVLELLADKYKTSLDYLVGRYK